MSNKNKKGVLVAVAAVSAAAVAAFAIFKRKQREEVFKEAELKAMEELDDLLADDDACEGCGGCECDEYGVCDCTPESDMEVEIIMAEAAEEETTAEIAEDAELEILSDEYIDEADKN